MKNKLMKLLCVVMIGLLMVACITDKNDVATLITEDTQRVEASTSNTPVLDNEAMMMAFTECLREHGVEVVDPVVDADGNVQKPELVEGTEWDKEAMGDAWEVCATHLVGFTAEKENVDTSEMVDRYVELAACLREKGYGVDDPTAETLNAWMGEFKNAINWDDPDAMADYEECNGETGGGKK